jgi:hypothetical protein
VSVGEEEFGRLKMTDRHAEVASRLAEAMNMVHAIRSGHGAAVGIPELRDLLVGIQSDLQAMIATGPQVIDINRALRAVSGILQGLVVPSWDQIDPEVSDAMTEFLASMRANEIGP